MTDPVVQKKSLKIKAKILIFSLLLLTAAALLACSFFIYSILSYDRVYNGVSVNGIDVSKMSYTEVYNLLDSEYSTKADGIKVILKNKELIQQIDLSQINVRFDVESAAKRALAVGRRGNIFHRLFEAYNTNKDGVRLDLDYSYDTNSVRNTIDNFHSRTLVTVKEADLFIHESSTVLRTGHPGESIDREKTKELIDNSIKTCTGGTFDVPLKVTMPSSINVDDIYNQIINEVKDAKVIVENNNTVIIPHTIGRQIDKAQLFSVIKEHEKTYDTDLLLPVTFIQPKIKTYDINNMLFRDVLAASTTKFSTSTQNNYNRGINIKVAASKINGIILGPGEEFSFNKVVGPRTVENGYQVAKEYFRGKIIDGIGGGVCQVSTTLYNAVLFSDLETVFRKNHMFTVGYVPLGRDAAVSYNDLDFKFKNNSNWPIKIESTVSKNNRITFKIFGTNEQSEKSIEISHVQISTKPAPVKYVNDPSLEEGKTVVFQEGMSGYVVDTFKIVKIGDSIVSKTKLHRSTYVPYERIIKKGTKKTINSTVDETLISQ